jgi:hypothetical protein
MKPDPRDYTHLVTRYARRYWASLYIALARAADTYDPSTGVPFEMYASKRLRWQLGDERWEENTGVAATGKMRGRYRLHQFAEVTEKSILRTPRPDEPNEFPRWVYDLASPTERKLLDALHLYTTNYPRSAMGGNGHISYAPVSGATGIAAGTIPSHVYNLRTRVRETVERAGQIKAQVADGAPVVSVQAVAEVGKKKPRGAAGFGENKSEKVERVAQGLARCREFTRPNRVGGAEKVA